MCNQFTLYHKFRIDTGRTKFRQGKTDNILSACESHGQGSQRSVQAWLDPTASCMVQAENVEKTPGYGVLGRYTACSTERIEVLSNKIERNHPLRHTPSLLYPEICCDGIWRNYIRESFYVTLASSNDFLQRLLDERIGVQKSLEAAKTPNESNQNQKPNYQERWDSRGSSNPLRRSEKMSCLVAKAPKTQERGDLWMNHHPARVVCQCLLNLVDKDEDADENVDADQTRTERPVDGQSFIQLEEIDIDFRVPGLSHAVVKETENFCVQEPVKGLKLILIERHFMPTCSRLTSTTHPAKNSKQMLR